MSPTELRWFRRAVLAMQYATGVFAAFCALMLLDQGKPFPALCCIIGFCLVAKQRLPDVPPDE